MKLKKNYKLVIAADGGAASGKTTGAKRISKKYGLKFLSSGLLYRYASYQLLKYKPKSHILYLKKCFKTLTLKKLNNKNLHSPEISAHASIIAKEKKIRSILKAFQKKFAKKYNKVCIEGRDINYAILPKADIKFFFKCSLDTAATRRYKELKKKNSKIKLKDVKKALRIRNISDTRRKNSPLLQHGDSVEIDTGKLDKSAMLAKMSKYVERVLINKYGNWTRTKKYKPTS